jgi:hypothetical protein
MNTLPFIHVGCFINHGSIDLIIRIKNDDILEKNVVVMIGREFTKTRNVQ